MMLIVKKQTMINNDDNYDGDDVDYDVDDIVDDMVDDVVAAAGDDE